MLNHAKQTHAETQINNDHEFPVPKQQQISVQKETDLIKVNIRKVL